MYICDFEDSEWFQIAASLYILGKFQLRRTQLCLQNDKEKFVRKTKILKEFPKPQIFNQKP